MSQPNDVLVLDVVESNGFYDLNRVEKSRRLLVKQGVAVNFAEETGLHDPQDLYLQTEDPPVTLPGAPRVSSL